MNISIVYDVCNYLHIVRICAHEELKGTLLGVKVILMKKMKKLLIGLAGLSLSVGAAIGVGLNADKGASEAKADTTKTIYVDTSISSKFKEVENKALDDEQAIHIYYEIGGVGTHLEAERKVTTNLFEFKVPVAALNNSSNGFRPYVWGAVNGEGEGDCSVHWISNSVLQYDNYNYVLVPATCPDEYGTRTFGYYGDKTSNPGASADTQRVWLKNDNSDFYNNDDWGTGCKNAIGYTYAASWHVMYMECVENAKNHNDYFYADIPASVTDVHFMRMSAATGHQYAVYQDAYISTLSYGVCHFAGTANYGDFVNITTGVVYGADEVLLSAVLSGYVVCTSDASNGANQTTVHNLFGTWIENKDGTTDMETTIKDYVSGSYTAQDPDSYDGLSKTADWSLEAKWNALCDHANVNPTTGVALSKTTTFVPAQSASNEALIAIITISAISLLAVGGYFFIRSKKEDR